MKKNPTLVVVDKYVADYLLDVSDSMQLDSGQEVCSIAAICQGHTYGISIIVHGQVRVNYKGDTFRHASQMPRELLDYFGGNRDSVRDNDVDIVENNWFEMVIYVDNCERQCDVVDIDFSELSKDEICGILITNLTEYASEVATDV